MRDRSKPLSPLFHLISVVILAAALIGLVIFFSTQFLKDISQGTSSITRLILPFFLILPIFLLAFLGFHLTKLFQSLKNNSPGARFKSRLLFFFLIISVVSSVPQAILSLSFINTGLNSWFSPESGKSLENGLSVTLQYFNEKQESFQTMFAGPTFAKALREADRNPEAIWLTLKAGYAGPDALQIFLEDDQWFFGKESAKMKSIPPNAPSEGIIPLQQFQEDLQGIQGWTVYSGRKGDYRIAVTDLFPRGFGTDAQALTQTVGTFRQLEEYKTKFQALLIVIYALFALPLLMMTMLTSFYLSDEIIQPLLDLEKATQAVTQGNFSIRLLGRTDDELAALKHSFNQMIEELDNSRMQNLQTDKIAAWQEIAQRLAHEIKNPLTPIQLSAQRILRKYKTNPEDLGRVLEPAVDSIIREVEHLTSMLNEFRNFARLPKPQKTTSNLAAMFQDVVATYGGKFPEVKIDRTHLNDEIEIAVDSEQIKQVLANLIKNGCEAIDGPGLMTIRSDLVRKGNSQYCRIQIQDSGCGIDEDQFDQVFNPYFTSKNEGTGLGLPIVERIIFDHRGQIWFESQKGVGTTFFIDLPMEKQF